METRDITSIKKVLEATTTVEQGFFLPNRGCCMERQSWNKGFLFQIDGAAWNDNRGTSVLSSKKSVLDAMTTVEQWFFLPNRRCCMEKGSSFKIEGAAWNDNRGTSVLSSKGAG